MNHSAGNISLFGYTDGATITKIVVTNVNITGNGDVGWLVGDNFSATANNSFWDTETSGQISSDGGTGKTTREMKTLATFTDISKTGLDAAWDFETNPNDDTANNDYWDMDNSGSTNNGYPFLSWESGEDISLPVDITIPVQNATLPAEFGLQKAFPNPFNPSVTIPFGLSEDGNMTLKVYNLRGELVEELINAYALEGTYAVSWQTHNLSTCVYIVCLQSENSIDMQKIVFLK